MKLNGTIKYCGPDDPPMDYYAFTLSDGRRIMIGFNSEEWKGNYQDGIPDLPKELTNCELEIRPR